jgi:hypothetical protein
MYGNIWTYVYMTLVSDVILNSGDKLKYHPFRRHVNEDFDRYTVRGHHPVWRDQTAKFSHKKYAFNGCIGVQMDDIP